MVSGRLLGDYMMLYKKFEQGERESYKLEMIAADHLPHLPKLGYEGSLASLYKNDFNYFLRYNIRDTEILKGLEHQLGYVDRAITLFRSATGHFDNVTGTVRLVDYNIYNYCKHELNVRVPDINNNSDVQVALKGAVVLDTQVGMHENVLATDINSLYPSAIMSVNISPDTLIGQFTDHEADVERIAAGTTEPCTFRDETTGEYITESAATWRQFLTQNNMTISGYGTVFTMDKRGIIPSILDRWFTQRLETNALIGKLEKEVVEIASKYTRIE